MTNTISDVEKYLGEARDLEDYWRDYGWEALNIGEIEEVDMSEVLDIYPLVEIDISVTITIKLPNKSYSVPLEDVSELSVNDCLVIGVSDLYPDWEDRIWTQIEKAKLLGHISQNEGWRISKYLCEDEKIRVVRELVD